MMVNSERTPRKHRVPLRKPPGRRPVAEESVRVGVSLRPAAAEWLNTEAERRGITMTDVIRRLIDEARRDYILRKER